MRLDEEDLAREFVEFLGVKIRSVWELDLLLFLRSHAESDWTPRELAAELRGNENAISEACRNFKKLGLTGEAAQGRIQYRRDAALNGFIGRLGDFYRERPLAVINAIYSGSSEKLNLLADAFKLRKD